MIAAQPLPWHQVPHPTGPRGYPDGGEQTPYRHQHDDQGYGRRPRRVQKKGHRAHRHPDEVRNPYRGRGDGLPHSEALHRQNRGYAHHLHHEGQRGKQPDLCVVRAQGERVRRHEAARSQADERARRHAFPYHQPQAAADFVLSQCRTGTQKGRQSHLNTLSPFPVPQLRDFFP